MRCEAMADDIAAMHDFMATQRRGANTGGDSGSSSSLNMAAPSMFSGGLFKYEGLEKVERRIQPAFKVAVSFVECMQGMASQVAMPNLLSQIQPPSTPVMDVKLGVLFHEKKGRK